jgi:hypothetical protein
MRIVPITLREAGAFIAEHHRHNKPPRGWKFGTSVQDRGRLVGVVTAGRPVSWVIQEREPLTIEVNRTCTDGTRNTNSMLYGAWRAARPSATPGRSRLLQRDRPLCTVGPDGCAT